MSIELSRRHFMTSAAAVAAGFTGLRALARDGMSDRPVADGADAGFGPLEPDPEGLIDLPPGFSYTAFSRTGEEMADGLVTPSLHDGMAAFPGPDGLTILVRNHEINVTHVAPGPFGRNDERVDRIDRSKLYDPGASAGEGPAVPSRGGTTTLLFETRTQAFKSAWLSLAGTDRNCAGGPTPRNTWISCEETVTRKGEHGRSKHHGYNFEVPASARMGLADPIPLIGMGRFNHEAIATNPYTGILYQTEDRHDGVLYRFLPNHPDRLVEGGRLQALAVRGRPKLDTRNWDRQEVGVGERLECEWLDVEDVDSPDDSLRFQMYDKGCARFARGEGMWYGRGGVYFACTNGGRAKAGQIFKYTPSPPEHEGRVTESSRPGVLELFIEPNLRGVLENADNITVAPWGDLVVCEDGANTQYMLGVTPEGRVYKLGRNRLNTSELAGACFSPDGSTLFVNIQRPGITLAITGPWRG